MKKYFFSIIIFVSFAVGCRAQDTVQYGDPYYWFNTRQYFEQRYGFLPWNQICCWRRQIHDTDFVFMYHTGERTLIYGVAVTLDTSGSEAPSIDKYDFELNLAQLRNDSLFFIDSTRWKPGDKRAHFTYSIPGDGQIYERTVPCFELYFDTPQVVRDTFFVGFKSNGWIQKPFFFSYDSSTTYFILDAHNNIANCSSHIDSAFNGNFLPCWGTLFPIVQYRYPCETPAVPRPIVYAATNPNLVQFQLPYSTGDSMWLSIAEYGQPADSGIIYNVTNSVMDIVVPDSGYYTARLCSFCTKYWDVPMQSAWSAPANFMITANLDIDQRDDYLASMLLLYPNPTDDEVTVSAKGALGEVTVSVMDMAGVEVLHREGVRMPLTFSTAMLKAGTYIVRLATPQGTAAKKLVVRK